MKASFFMALFFTSSIAPAVFGQGEQELRKVNSVTVDLAPVRQWFREKQGERPLKHWKLLEIVGVKEAIGSWQKCLAKNENGDNVELLIQNLPAAIPKHFAELKQCKQQLDILNGMLTKSSAAVAMADATTPRGAFGTPDYVDAVMKERYRVELAKLGVEARKEKAASLARDLAELQAKRQLEFAMFSGRKYGGLEIWDCGQPVK